MVADGTFRPERRFPRYPCHFAGVVQSGAGRTFMATVQEVAAGGARFIGATDLRPGDRLSMRFLGRRPATIPARVVWVVRKDGVSRTGVEFALSDPTETREVAGLVASVGGKPRA